MTDVRDRIVDHGRLVYLEEPRHRYWWLDDQLPAVHGVLARSLAEVANGQRFIKRKYLERGTRIHQAVYLDKRSALRPEDTVFYDAAIKQRETLLPCSWSLPEQRVWCPGYAGTTDEVTDITGTDLAKEYGLLAPSLLVADLKTGTAPGWVRCQLFAYQFCLMMLLGLGPDHFLRVCIEAGKTRSRCIFWGPKDHTADAAVWQSMWTVYWFSKKKMRWTGEYAKLISGGLLDV